MSDLREQIRSSRPDPDVLAPLDLQRLERRARRSAVATRVTTATAAVAVLVVAGVAVNALRPTTGIDFSPAAPGTTTEVGDTPDEVAVVGWDHIEPGDFALNDVEAVLADSSDIEVISVLDAHRWAPEYSVAFDVTSDGDVVAYDAERRQLVQLGGDDEPRPLTDSGLDVDLQVRALQIGPDGWVYLIGSDGGNAFGAQIVPIDDLGQPRAAWTGQMWQGITFVDDIGWVQVDEDRWEAAFRTGQGALTTDEQAEIPARTQRPDGVVVRYDAEPFGDRSGVTPSGVLTNFELAAPGLDGPRTWQLETTYLNGWASPTIRGGQRELVIVDRHGADGLDSLALAFDIDGTLRAVRVDVQIAPAFDGIGASPVRIGADGRLYWSRHLDDGAVEVARYRHPLPPFGGSP